MKVKRTALAALLLVVLFSQPAHASRHYHYYGYYVNSQMVLNTLCKTSREMGFWSPACLLRGFGNAYYSYHGYRYHHEHHRHKNRYHRP